MATAKKAGTSAKSGAKTVAKTGAKSAKGKVASLTKANKAKPKSVKAAPKATPKVATKANLKAIPKATPKPAPKAVPKTAPKTVTKSASPKVELKVVTKAPPKVEKAEPVAVAGKAAVKLPRGAVMSEAELLRQPKSEYMSKDQLAFFRQRLMELQAQLRENAGATTEHLRELAVAPDPADRATLEEEHALELRARDRERKLLKKVEGAMQRIDSGEYGYCEETGEPIGIPRLLARPTATLTIEAQERRELKQKMYGE